MKKKETNMAYAVKKDKTYTYKDYLTWPNEERWEIVAGTAYDMSAAPRIKHQNITGNFFIKLKTHPDNPCYTGIAPTNVVFDEYNVVQPDVLAVCDRNKITEDNIQGAPDLIVEVISEGTEVKDRREKKNRLDLFSHCSQSPDWKISVVQAPACNYIKLSEKNNNDFSWDSP